jgi:hypothetical protein
VLVVIVALSMLPTAALAVGISFNGTPCGTLDDCALFASYPGMAGTPFSVPLGNLNLSTVTGAVVEVPVGDGLATDWWLIGHQSSHIVYSSTLNLAGVALDSIEPFSLGATPASVITNLIHFNSGIDVSYDIWALLSFNHSSHNTADGNTSNLWRFSDGEYLGQVAVSINTNVPPGPSSPIPIPTTILLLGSGLIGIAGLRRKF